jgi:hypothetical protein
MSSNNAFGEYQRRISNHDRIIASIMRKKETRVGQNIEDTQGDRDIDIIEKITRTF